MSNKAVRTSKGSDMKETGDSEYGVERIVAKRFNPKKKCWEYQIKWEHFPRLVFTYRETIYYVLF